MEKYKQLQLSVFVVKEKPRGVCEKFYGIYTYVCIFSYLRYKRFQDLSKSEANTVCQKTIKQLLGSGQMLLKVKF